MTGLELEAAHKALTPAGRRWTERNETTSTLARVAIHGADTGWPIALIKAAVEIANYEAERRASKYWLRAA